MAKKQPQESIESDARLGQRCESIICMRTHFTGEPPYVGNHGVVLALREVLDERDNLREWYRQTHGRGWAADIPDDVPPLASISEEEQQMLRPMAETLAMLDGNAFFSDELFWRQYVPEAKALFQANGGIEGWAGMASFAKKMVPEGET